MKIYLKENPREIVLGGDVKRVERDEFGFFVEGSQREMEVAAGLEILAEPEVIRELVYETPGFKEAWESAKDRPPVTFEESPERQKFLDKAKELEGKPLTNSEMVEHYDRTPKFQAQTKPKEKEQKKTEVGRRETGVKTPLPDSYVCKVHKRKHTNDKKGRALFMACLDKQGD